MAQYQGSTEQYYSSKEKRGFPAPGTLRLVRTACEDVYEEGIGMSFPLHKHYLFSSHEICESKCFEA